MNAYLRAPMALAIFISGVRSNGYAVPHALFDCRLHHACVSRMSAAGDVCRGHVAKELFLPAASDRFCDFAHIAI